MTFDALPISTQFGPLRRGLIRLLIAIFVTLLVLMLLLGTLLVLLQLAGVIIGDGQYVIDVEKNLGPWTYGAAAAFGVTTLLVSLAFGWKSTE